MHLNQLIWIFSVVVTMGIAQNSLVAEMTFRINEELDTGTFIGNVAAESNMANKRLTFKFSSGDETLVVLNSSSGELKTKKIIDRETVCKNQRNCVFIYTILAYEGGDLYSINVNLVIVDINDNTPYFESTTMTLNLSEALPLDSVKPLLSASDLDKGDNNSVVGYSFSPFLMPNAIFDLQVEQNTDNSLSLSLKLVKMLDRETVDTYVLIILAKDGGTPVRTGTLTVTVNVLDENDNKPLFNAPFLNVSVTEDIAVGKVIVTLKATDKDAGKNGEIHYHLAQSQEQYVLDHFNVNLISGELSVAKQLGYPVQSNNVTIIIVADDLGTPPLFAQAVVNLTIVDIGNKPPQVKLTFLAEEIAPNVIEVSENASLNEAIVHMSVEDKDTGVNGVVTCQMRNTFFGLKNVSNSQNAYIIFIQHTLDRESISLHNITITCTDGGYMETSVHFVLAVKDENDNAPSFSQYIYIAWINENNTYGVSIFTVYATDADDGENGRISYFMQPNYARDFEVEENTGIVRVRTILDREKESEKSAEVLAIDHGNPALISTATIILTIQDINDNEPIFTRSIYEFKVSENMEANTFVDKVTVTDADQGENKRTECYMFSPYVKQFTVLPDGRIVTNVALDREENSEYMFDVGVHDYGVPRLNNSVRVIVRIDDANDNIPSFVFPSADNYTVEALNEVSDTEIATVFAKDADAGINKELLYFIVEGNDEGIFRLDSNTGKLFIAKYVHSASDRLSQIKLTVSDKGHPPLFSSGKLIVNQKCTNVTYLPEADAESKKNYVVIVATVVCITCLLSVTIVIVICLIRRKDTFGNRDRSNKFTEFLTTKVVQTQHVSHDTVYPEVLPSKNKKEVSFSIEDGVSVDSNEYFKVLTTKDKGLFLSWQTPHNDLPEVVETKCTNPLAGILRTGQTCSQSHSRVLDNGDIQLNVNHQREDSNSEKSTETTTSRDSGKGGSVEGDTHEHQYDMLVLGAPRAVQEQPYRSFSNKRQPPIPAPSLIRSTPPAIPPKSSLSLNAGVNKIGAYNENLKCLQPRVNNFHNQSRSRSRCHRLDLTGSYPESDYLSLNSNQNCSKGQASPHRNPQCAHIFQNIDTTLIAPHSAYHNSYETYRSNSTRDDDETTTTSGSYTIQPEDGDSDSPSTTFHMSHVV